jgi:phosphate transport system substrate-binding protein
MKLSAAVLVAASVLLGGQVLADPPIRIQSTPSLAAFAKDLVRPLREQGIELKLEEEAGNTQVIADLGQGEIHAALLTRPLNVEERVNYPDRHFVEVTLGTQAVAMVVARSVWESGIHSLKRGQIVDLYESKVRSWKELGGEERPLVFFEPAHEHGPWEIFATWLYGDIRKAPGVPWQTVVDGADTQTALQFSSGAISVAGLRWVDRKDVFPLALIDDAGKPIEPTLENIAAGVYPLTRPVIIAFSQEPSALKKKFLEYLLGEKGQQIIAAHDFLPQTAIDAAGASVKKEN